MSVKSIVFVSSLVFALSAAPVVVLAQDVDTKPAKVDRIQKLFDRLSGSNDFDDREDATDELIKAGKAIAPRLQKLHDTTKDAEVKARARFILDRLGKTAETEEEAPADPRKTQPREGGGGPQIVPLPGMEELFKNMPEGFKKMLQGLQKEMEKEVQDMLDPNNPGSKEQQGQPGKPRIRTFTWSNTPQRRKGPRRVRLHDTGISAERPAAALRSHLGLGLKDGGIVVGAIAPGSYAEKAGLKIHDVILKVKGETVTSVADLESLRAGGGAIDVIRKGARSSIPAPKLAGKPQKPVTPQPKAEKKAEKKELPKDF